jgi:hypothetical protein
MKTIEEDVEGKPPGVEELPLKPRFTHSEALRIS